MSLRFGSGWLVIYFLIFFLYAHMFRSLEPRTGLYDELEHMHAKPSSHSGRIVGNSYLTGIMEG
jgi:hypothetical protein